MKRIVLIFLVVLYFVLNYGYYDYLEDADLETIPFKKKYLTLQIKFHNIFANQGEGKTLRELSLEDRQRVIDYCKYRLGIITALSTEADLERCSYGHSPGHFNSDPPLSNAGE